MDVNFEKWGVVAWKVPHHPPPHPLLNEEYLDYLSRKCDIFFCRHRMTTGFERTWPVAKRWAANPDHAIQRLFLYNSFCDLPWRRRATILSIVILIFFALFCWNWCSPPIPLTFYFPFSSFLHLSPFYLPLFQTPCSPWQYFSLIELIESASRSK